MKVAESIPNPRYFELDRLKEYHIHVIGIK